MEPIPMTKDGSPSLHLGKILIEIDIDVGQYNVGFSDVRTCKLLQPQEIQMIVSPFHIACIINEIKRRQEAAGNKIIPVTGFNPNQLKGKLKPPLQ